MADSSEWKVLIVDNEPDNLGVIEIVLQFHKATVSKAASGQECLDILQNQERPTLILLDIQMPTMSGYEVLEKIRADEKLKDLPVIAVTAFAMEGDREKALEKGFDGYIPKPISPVTLVDDIARILDKKQEAKNE